MKKRISPYKIIALSFCALIILGTLILKLPFSTQEGHSLSWIDAFFTSASAVTITGMDATNGIGEILSPFGRVILAILVQIGGLSVITISVFVMLIVGAKIGITNRFLIKESLNQKSMSGVVKLVKRILLTTCVIECIGFVINLIVFLPLYPVQEALGLSAFHAIMSFNNAGFDLLGGNLEAFSGHVLLNLNTIIMIMLGGIGFIVIHDMLEKKSYKRLMIHSKIVLKVNVILWVLGTVIFKFSQMYQVEHYTWLESLFLSVTARTAGFSTIRLSTLSSISTLILLILMFIGASPSSTGGGIKVTTLYTMVKSVGSFARGQKTTTHHRLISGETKNKAFILFALSLFIVLISSIFLLFFDNLTLEEALFESVSSFSNTGLTLNVTSMLSIFSKIILIINMFVGRVGPLVVIALFNHNWYQQGYHHVEYIEEKVIIG